MTLSRIRIVVVAGAVAVGILAAYLLAIGLQPEGPTHAGRTLSRWLADIDGQPGNPDRTSPQFVLAPNAVVQIGTHGLPFLLEWIQFERSRRQLRVTAAMARLLARLPSTILPRQLQVFLDQGPVEYRRRWAAAYALEVLGPNVKSAIPQLASIAADPAHPAASYMATRALCTAGPAGWPEVLRLTTNSHTGMHRAATVGLVPLGTNALPAIPALLAHLAGTNEADAKLSARVLGKLRLEPDRVFPLLAHALEASDFGVREASAMALAEFGAQASPTLPALRQALKSGDLHGVNTVSNSIQMITAAAATEDPLR